MFILSVFCLYKLFWFFFPDTSQTKAEKPVQNVPLIDLTTYCNLSLTLCHDYICFSSVMGSNTKPVSNKEDTGVELVKFMPFRFGKKMIEHFPDG